MLIRPGIPLRRIASTLLFLLSQAVKVLTVNGRAPELQVERVQRKFAEVCVCVQHLGDRGEGAWSGYRLRSEGLRPFHVPQLQVLIHSTPAPTLRCTFPWTLW